MSEPFIGEIRIFTGNFAPRGWAFCDGTLLPISQNAALFSILGVTYGGDGESTTALPNLQGRAPMHPGHGPGLTPRSLGEHGGQPTTTVSVDQMPPHKHPLRATNSSATTRDPGKNLLGRPEEDTYGQHGQALAMDHQATAAQGGGQPHNNLQPYLALNFIIALVGLYPSRS